MIEIGAGRVSAVPDARMPLLSEAMAVKPSKCGGVRRPQQVLRRASVLAAARRRMADHGYDKVTVRMVAADCDTTAQTVFNLVGNRTQLMTQAITDHGTALTQAARSWTPYPFMLLALADVLWHSALLNEAFVRQSSLNYTCLNSVSHDAFGRAVLKSFHASLADASRDLRPSADRALTAEVVSSTISGAIYDWARGEVDLANLRRNLVARSALILMGAVKPEAGAIIEAWLPEFLRAARREAAAPVLRN